MYLVKKYLLRITLISLVLTSSAIVRAFYVPTSRDTLPAPETVTYDINEPEELELLFEAGDLKYYYRESRDYSALLSKPLSLTAACNIRCSKIG